MAIDPCDPCGCVPANVGEDFFRQAALVRLCAIIEAIEEFAASCDCVVDGAVVDAATTGGLALGTDGTNYQVISVSSTGAVNVNGAKAEDSVAASGDLGIPGLHVIEATPAASAADGDYGFSKLNAVGAQFTEPSNQVATYGGTTTAGAAGAVPTTGVVVHVNAAKAKIVTVTNALDVPVQISLNAGTTYIQYVPVNGSTVLDLGASGRWTASNIFAKAIGSNSASGNIYVGTVI